jgi:ArsR family transcriptional regulator
MRRSQNPAKTSCAPGPWDEPARLLRVIAHPVRLLILDALADRTRCVKDLNSLIPIPQAHLSQHMAALRKADLVASHSDGPLRCYYLCRPTLVRKLIPLLRMTHPIRHRARASVQREVRGKASGSRPLLLHPRRARLATPRGVEPNE